MRVIIILLFIILGACAGPQVKLPPTQCAYVSHQVKQCNRVEIERVFGKMDDEGKAWACDIENPHFSLEPETCRYLY